MPKLTATQIGRRARERRRKKSQQKSRGKSLASKQSTVQQPTFERPLFKSSVLQDSSEDPSGDTDENDRFLAKNEVDLRFDPEEVASDELYDRFYSLEKQRLADPSLYPSIKDEKKLAYVTSNPIIGERSRLNVMKQVDDERVKRKTYRKKKRDKKRRSKKLKRMTTPDFGEIPEEFMRSLATRIDPRQSQYLSALDRSSRALPSVRTVNICNAILQDIKDIFTSGKFFEDTLKENASKHRMAEVRFKDYLDTFLTFSDKNHAGYELMIKLNTETVHGTWILSQGLSNQYSSVIETYDMSDDPYPDVPLVDVDSPWICPPLGGSPAQSEKIIKDAYLKKERDQSWERYVQEKLRLGEEPDTQEWYGVWDNESETLNSRPWNNLFTEDGFMEIMKMIGEDNIINVCRVKGLKDYMKAIIKMYKRGSFLWWCYHTLSVLIFYPKTSQNPNPPLINRLMMENIKDFFIYTNEERNVTLDLYNEDLSVDRMYLSFDSIHRMTSQIMNYVPNYGNGQELYDLFMIQYETFKNKILSQVPDNDKNREKVCKAFHELIYLLDIGRSYEGDDVLTPSVLLKHTSNFMNTQKIKTQVNKFNPNLIRRNLTKRGLKYFEVNDSSSS